MDASATIANRFLTNVLNTDGITHYKRADYVNSSGSNTINMLYYDSRKIKYHSVRVLTSYFRDITLYKLYHNTPDLPQTYDTTFIYCAVAHLKAGSTDSDLQTRKLQTQYAMGNLNTSGIVSNIMFMGDLNTQSSSENSFQNLITHSNANIRFYDPVNKLGTWNNNASYKAYHTQSTNVSSNNCVSGGGLDDRFDFILINGIIKNNTQGVSYIDGSYKALGQDGNRFNSTVIYPANAMVPADVANALYSASDHLPVILKLFVDRLPASVEDYNDEQPHIITYELIGRQLGFQFTSPQSAEYAADVYDMHGRLLVSNIFKAEAGAHSVSLNLNQSAAGLCILRLTNRNNGHFITLKFFVN